MEAFVADAGDNAPEVDPLRRELEELKLRNLRLLADYDNQRRRMQREHEAAHHEGRRAALLPLLHVVDSLERALAAGSIDREFFDGVAATHRQFLAALREAGAEPVETIGLPLDPKAHEAVGTIRTDDVEPGIIVDEVRRGWRLGTELLRPAQVQIAAPPETPDPWR